MKRCGAIRGTTWIHGSEGVRWRGGRRVAVRQQDDAQVDRDWPEEGISAVSSVRRTRTNASRRQEQPRVCSSEEHKTFDKEASRWVSSAATGRGVGSACCGYSTSTGGAEGFISNRLHQTCGPVNQQRQVPTDHEARGQAQRRQLRRVATELRRDHDPEAGAKHAKHDRIRTQADHQSRMTSVRGTQNDLHALSLEGTQVVLVSPANQPAQRRARAAELWRSVRKGTRGSARGRANSLSKQGIA